MWETFQSFTAVVREMYIYTAAFLFTLGWLMIAYQVYWKKEPDKCGFCDQIIPKKNEIDESQHVWSALNGYGKEKENE